MSKTTVILIVAALLLVGGGGLTGYFLLKSGKTDVSKVADSINLSKEEVKGELSYDDSSGFSFKYPKGIKVTDETPEDNIYYTLLVLGKSGQKLTIAAKDTQALTASQWVKGETSYQGFSLVGATTLGGLSAQQYASGETLITLVIDQGVLYLIEGPKDGGFWEDTQNVVASTFAFAGTKSQGAGSDGAIYEEEEVVE